MKNVLHILTVVLFFINLQLSGVNRNISLKETYDIGFKVIQLKDQNRKYELKNGKKVSRPIHLYVWYPAEIKNSDQKLKYVDYLFIKEKINKNKDISLKEKNKIIRDFIGKYNDEKENILKKIETKAVLNAEKINKKFPLLLFGPGGSTDGLFYSSLCEFLASKGYIAIAIPSLSYNENKRWPFNQSGLELHVNDMEFVIEYAKTQKDIDINKIGLVAFSVGGVSQTLLQMKNDFAKAFVSLDGGTGYEYGYNMIKNSKFFNMKKMNIPYFHAHGLKSAMYIVKKNFSIFYKNKTSDKYLLTFDDLSHADHTSHYNIKTIINNNKKNRKTLEQFKILNIAVLNFVNYYLKNDKKSKINLLSMNSNKFLAIEDYKSPNLTKKRLIKDFFKNYDDSVKALKEKNYPMYMDLSHKLVQYTQDHPIYMYQYAKALALAGKLNDSLAWLEELLKMKFSILKSVNKDEGFKGLYNNKKFNKIKERIKIEFKPVKNSKVAFTIRERDLMSEGVAFDSLKKVLYVGSIYKRKIVSITQDGKIKDFIRSKQDGILGVIGMEVDVKRRHLWVCSARSGRNDILGIKGGGESKPTAVFKYNLKNGKLIKKYSLKNYKGHMFNDLTVSSDGDVYITDTTGGNVYVIKKNIDRLEVFYDGIMYPNGITISDDDNDLFIAYYTGLDKINLKTGESIQLDPGTNNTLVFIDGLTYYKNSLIAHQGSTYGGVCQYFLNEGRSNVVERRPLELFNPLFNFTTTGELNGDTYYYLANAQFRNYNRDGSIFPNAKLSDVYILEVPLTLKNK